MTNAEFAVLSLLSERPRHGYDIEKTIVERGMREWTEIGFSSIYYLLNKLEKEGLLEGRNEKKPGRGPARKVFYITPAGRKICRQKTLDVLATPFRCYPPILLGLANLPVVNGAEAISALTKHHEGLLLRLKQLRGKRSAQGTLPYFVDSMFVYSQTMIEAEIKMIEDIIQRLEKENDKG